MTRRPPGRCCTAVLTILSAGLVAAAAGVPDLPRPSPVPVADYLQYWAASRVNLDRGNPYDWEELLAAERRVEPSMATPVMMWNPPWTFSLTTLPSLLPYELSRVCGWRSVA